ncbi:MAG TPA: addiction module protein [Rudaea sp.]|jgi:putative addiction module component (TIGR02574 family)|uniref:addiction module protein n=1 Tax=Rudaea sp. TaxID=2136325 RepID=UPI002F94F12B
MAASVTELFVEASELAESDRAALAGLLLESLESPPEVGIEAAWVEEVERRVKQIELGEVEAVSWEEVRERLRTRLRGN